MRWQWNSSICATQRAVARAPGLARKLQAVRLPSVRRHEHPAQNLSLKEQAASRQETRAGHRQRTRQRNRTHSRAHTGNHTGNHTQARRASGRRAPEARAAAGRHPDARTGGEGGLHRKHDFQDRERPRGAVAADAAGLVNALDRDLASFFGSDPNLPGLVLRAGQRPVVLSDPLRSSSQVRYERLVPFGAGHLLEGNVHVVEPHGDKTDRKSTRLNSSHGKLSRMPSSA